MIELASPFRKEDLEKLNAGDRVSLSGVIYTGRDQAHKRLVEMIERREKLPFDILDQGIYYVGPTPAGEGMIIGSAGPTTSYRMDAFAPTLMDQGLKVMIGKGPRSDEVKESMRKNGAVYLAAVGGAGALISKCITSAQVIAFEDLGTEAIRRLTVENMNLIVAIDSKGKDLYHG